MHLLSFPIYMCFQNEGKKDKTKMQNEWVSVARMEERHKTEDKKYSSRPLEWGEWSRNPLKNPFFIFGRNPGPIFGILSFCNPVFPR